MILNLDQHLKKDPNPVHNEIMQSLHDQQDYHHYHQQHLQKPAEQLQKGHISKEKANLDKQAYNVWSNAFDQFFEDLSSPTFHPPEVVYKDNLKTPKQSRKDQMLYKQPLLSPVSMNCRETSVENQMKNEEDDLFYYKGGKYAHESESNAHFNTDIRQQGAFFSRPSSSSLDMYGTVQQNSMYSPAPTHNSFDDAPYFPEHPSPNQYPTAPGSSTTVSSFGHFERSEDDIRETYSNNLFEPYFPNELSSYEYEHPNFGRAQFLEGNPMAAPMTPTNSSTSMVSKRTRGGVSRSATNNNNNTDPKKPNTAGGNKMASPNTNSASRSAGNATKPRPSRKRKSSASGTVSSGSFKAIDKKDVPKLNRPLSELTAGYTDIPLRNMDAWVHRSLETRHKEVQKRKGFIARPMNSFMLYRSAYAERTKHWCTQNNHQVVSSVSGASWVLEPKEITDHYNELAKIERQNHQMAHPGYKFSPSKSQLIGKKRKGSNDDIESKEDINRTGSIARAGPHTVGTSGPTVNSKQPPAKKKKAAHTATTPTPSSSITSALPQLAPVIYHGSAIGALKSSYEITNPGKRAPSEYGSPNPNIGGSYYQMSIKPASSSVSRFSNIEDVTIRRTQGPLGKGNPAFSSTPMMNQGQPIEGEQWNGMNEYARDPVFGQPVTMMVGDLHALPGYDPSMTGIMDNEEPWDFEGDFERDFEIDEWVNQ